MQTIVSLSGGIDSGACLAWHIDQGDTVHCVMFDYGQKNYEYEHAAALDQCKYYELQLQTIEMKGIACNLKSATLIGGENIPDGHYTEETQKKTVVPGRNLIFISILAGIAESHGIDQVSIGLHKGGEDIYPDCSPDFFLMASYAVSESSGRGVKLIAPYLHHTKSEVIAMGRFLRMPLARCRTCLKDQPLACGQCGPCQQRLEGFKIVGMDDPLDYEYRDLSDLITKY